jgi:hypothetical protein
MVEKTLENTINAKASNSKIITDRFRKPALAFSNFASVKLA